MNRGYPQLVGAIPAHATTLFHMKSMPKQAVNSETPRVNVIAEGTTLEGTVVTACDIRISGTVTGTLKGSTRVVVAPGATVEGDLHAAEATIAGTVKGKIMVKERPHAQGLRPR